MTDAAQPCFSTSNDEVPPEQARQPSPSPPPFSPITPTMSVSLPAKNEGSSTNNVYVPPLNTVVRKAAASQHESQGQTAASQQQEPQPPPPSRPISMSDNPDAIALRATMSILQIQRQQALRDMKRLEQQKIKALADPEAFARGVSEGKIQARSVQGIVPTADEQDQDEDSEDDMSTETPGSTKVGGDGGKVEPFGTIPSAQNVVRMPPVNWAKYHIVGESLDKLHEEQRARPIPGQPLRDEDLRPKERAPESVIAAPYNPWVDKVGEKPTRTRNGAKRK